MLALVERTRRFPLSENEKAALSKSLVGTRRFSRGDTILDPAIGDCSKLYLLTEGWAARFLSFRDGARQITEIFVAGDFCNLSTLDRIPSHRVVALSQVTVTVVKKSTLKTALAAHPMLAEAFMSLCFDEAATLRIWLACMGRRTRTVHLAHLFCEIHARLHKVGLAEDHSFRLPLTQEILADITGMSVVHVNRILHQLREDGLIRLHAQHLDILQPRRMAELAEFDPAYLRLG